MPSVRCSDVDQLRDLFGMVERDYGILHVLYNHVGMPGAAGMDLLEKEWQEAIDVNLKSAFFGTQLGLPLLRRAAGQASVIFTASTTGLVGSPYSPTYSAAKGGVVLLAKAFALHVAKEGVRANVILPGPDRHADAAIVFRPSRDARRNRPDGGDLPGSSPPLCRWVARGGQRR